eukprot:SM000072S21223  [mRNA]  locus=s72:471389:479752:+ [translate_table: standard]
MAPPRSGDAAAGAAAAALAARLGDLRALAAADGPSGHALCERVRALLRSGGTSGSAEPGDRHEAERLRGLRISVVTTILGLLHAGRLPPERAGSDCLTELMRELGRIPVAHLPAVVEPMLAYMETEGAVADSRHYDMLSKCLSLIHLSPEVVLSPVDGSDHPASPMPGLDYFRTALERMLACPWTPSSLTAMVVTLRELPMDREQLELAVKKVIQGMREVELQGLPPLVYQLLLLGSARDLRGLVAAKLAGFFWQAEQVEASQEPKAETAHTGSQQKPLRPRNRANTPLGQVKGSIILHINFAVKQDAELGQEWFRLLKLHKRQISSFLVSVLLSLARIRGVKQASLQLLMSTIQQLQNDCRRCRGFAWTPPSLEDETVRAVEAAETAFLQAVHYGNTGGEHIIESSVQLAFMLLDSSGSVDCTGTRMILIAFDEHKMARDMVIEQCVLRISRPQNLRVVKIVRLIERLIQSRLSQMMDYHARLTDCLDCLPILPPDCARALLRALAPILQYKRNLQRHTVVVLRKALFSHEPQARMVGVKGILQLIVDDCQAHSASSSQGPSQSISQCSSSQSSAQLQHCKLNLVPELLAYLRRCFSQQFAVRTICYRGLPQVLQSNPDLREVLLGLLESHFLQYYIDPQARKESEPPLPINKCFRETPSGTVMDEPLDQLLATIKELLTFQSLDLVPKSQPTDYKWIRLGFSESQVVNQAGHGSIASRFAAAFADIKSWLHHSQPASLFASSFTLPHCPPDLYQFGIGAYVNGHVPAESSQLEVKERANLFLGILELLIDSVVLEIPAIGDGNVLEEQLMHFIRLHNELLSLGVFKPARRSGRPARSQNKGNGPVVEPVTSSSPAAVKLSRQDTTAPASTARKRQPLLSSKAIGALLQMVTRRSSYQLLDVPGDKELQATSADEQTMSSKDSQDLCRFALASCETYLRWIRYSQSMQDGLNDSPKGTDWLRISQPLLLFVLYLSNINHQSLKFGEVNTRQMDPVARHKSGSADCSKLEHELLIAISCLKHLIKVAITGDIVDSLLCCHDCNHDRSMELGSAERQDPGCVHMMVTLLHNLLASCAFQEAEVVAEALLLLIKFIPEDQRRMLRKLVEQMCHQQSVSHAGAAKSLLLLWLSLCSSLRADPGELDDLKVALSVATEAHTAVLAEQDGETVQSSVLPFVTTGSSSAVLNTLLSHAERALQDCDWLHSHLMNPQNFEKVEETASPTPHASRRNATQLQLQAAAGSRFELIVQLLAVFLTVGPAAIRAEQFLRVTMKLFKCLASTAKAWLARKGQQQVLPSSTFQQLARTTCSHITSPLYLFMDKLQKEQAKESKKISLSSIRKESRTIPDLIFHMEDYEKYLIKLSKTTGVNLMRHAKRSTARDFRILDPSRKRKLSNGAPLPEGTRQARLPRGQQQQDTQNVQESEKGTPESCQELCMGSDCRVERGSGATLQHAAVSSSSELRPPQSASSYGMAGLGQPCTH